MPRYAGEIIAAPGPGCLKPGISENLDFRCGFPVYIVLPSSLSLKTLTTQNIINGKHFI